MSLDKTRERKQRLREQNRRLRRLGQVELSPPGPWFEVPLALRFDPSFFRNLLGPQQPVDATQVGQTVPPLD